MTTAGPRRLTVRRYAVAVFAVGVVLAFKSALWPMIGVEGPFLLFLGAVLAAAWSGGVGPGLVATALSATAVGYFFIPPYHQFRITDGNDYLRVLQFLAEGVFISVLSGLRKRSSEEAHRRMEQLRATLQSIGDAVLTTDAEGRVRLLNPAAEALTGCSAATAAGRPVGEVLPLADEEARERTAPLARALRGETVRRAEHRAVRPDGSSVWLRVNATPVRDGRAAPDGAVLVLGDVTAEREADQALRRSHAALRSRLATISEDERRRISRELHDETSQRLTALTLGLKTLRGRPEAGRAEVAAALESFQTQATQISQALHRIAWELRPAVLDDMGLESALRDAAGRWAERTGTRVEFHGTIGPRRLQPDIETHLYRMVNEAVANALKHAGATRVGVVLGGPPDEVTAVVEDDGRGFDPGAVERSAGGRRRLGLHGLWERAALIGGSVEVESAPGRGTTVFIRVPLAVRVGGGP